MDDVVRQLNYVFFNRKPAANPTQGPQTGTEKTISGNVNGFSNNGFSATYQLVTPPKYGSVTLKADGTYTYQARSELVEPGIIDQFTVKISNAPTTTEPGALGQLQTLLHSLAIAFGVAQQDTITTSIKVTVTGSGVYGDQAANAEWWIKQTIDNSCVLIADAVIFGQLQGRILTENEAVALGKSTTSVVDPPNAMYVGSKKDTGAAGVYHADGVALLNMQGLKATGKSYVDPIKPGETADKASQEDGQRALSDVEAALAAGNAVAISVDSNLIMNAAGEENELASPEANHWVVVTGVDLSTGKVYVNDGNLKEGSTPVSLGGFMWAWQASNFFVAIAEKPKT
ncbi:Ig-like domain-containing protein [Mycolicibacterium sp. Dal123E01]|uniref:Ig-like domain-containing protein n=1 Tax=Mycolicibacterium sp. Dal123E01 TaxID=3457578 RepID=UPI00403E9337